MGIKTKISDKIVCQEKEIYSIRALCEETMHRIGHLDDLVETAVRENDPESKEKYLEERHALELNLREKTHQVNNKLQELRKLESSLAAVDSELAGEAHDWDPMAISAGSNKSLEWKCSEGHIYEAFVHNRVSKGTGCPYCSKRKALTGVSDLGTTHPELAKEAYGWDAATVMAGTHKSLAWRCEAGHVYEKSPFLRTKNNRSMCPECKEVKMMVHKMFKAGSKEYKEYLTDEGFPIEPDSIGVGFERIRSESWDNSLASLKESILKEGLLKNILVSMNHHNVTENGLTGQPWQLIDGELRLHAFIELRKEYPDDDRFEFIDVDVLDHDSFPIGFFSGHPDHWVVSSPRTKHKTRSGDLGRVAEALENETSKKTLPEEDWKSVSIMPDLEIRARGEYSEDLAGLERLAAAIRSRIEEV